MKITNIEDFNSMLSFAFSTSYEELKESEKNIIKNQIMSSIGEIEGVQDNLIKRAKSDLEELVNSSAGYDTYEECKRRILFILSITIENDRFNIISEYIINENNIRSYHRLDEYILIPMLDYLPDDLKIEVLSKANSVDLFKFMSKLNETVKYQKKDRKTRKKHAKYYEICQKALAVK